MDYAALKAADPGGDLATALAALVAETVSVTVDVPISAVEGYMLTRGIIAAADAWATANPADATGVLGAIRSLEGLMASPRLQAVTMTDPATAGAVQQMLGGMAQAGIMTGAQMAEILAMATAHISRADQIGWGILRQMDRASAEYHLSVARAL